MSPKRIVLTGGPSGGKTTLIDVLHKDLGHKIAVVPEAASILYRGGFPRRKTDQSRIYAQRAIYFTQKELESLNLSENSAEALVCDRGSLDALAYWPKGEMTMFESLNTSLEKELARYDWVLHLETASMDHFDTTNTVRIETYQEAFDLNEKIKQAWSEHPRRVIIPHQNDFFAKLAHARKIVQMILDGETLKTIQEA